MGRPDDNKVFVDTTAFYAVLDPAHEVHDRVVAAWFELLGCGARLFTSSYVCSELLALVQASLGFDKVQTFLGELRPHVVVLTVDSALHARAVVGGKRDLRGLIPRTSRALMAKFGVTTVFTLDEGMAWDRFRRVKLGQPAEQPHAPDRPEPSAESETMPRAPRRHGARRGTRSSGVGRSLESRPPPPRPQPELICREAPGAWHWEVLLLVSDECNVAGVRYRGHPLHADGVEYRLSSLEGTLIVDQADGTGIEIALGTAHAPMIFKLADKWSGVGRRMDAISRGHFIVMAPVGWKRKGPPPVAPAATADSAFQAHYFFRGAGPSADFVGFEECDLALAHSGFTLMGQCLFDDFTGGELFIGAPPELRPGRGVMWARVGEEKEGGWRGENFLPAERSLADALDQREGRFFVRVYESNNSVTKLRDSGEFRFIRGLHEILVDGEPYTPTILLPPEAGGHARTRVQFVDEKGVSIRPMLQPDSPFQWSEDAIVVESRPVADQVKCVIVTPSDSVPVCISLPRIWWQLVDVNPGPWHSVPLTVNRREFREHAHAGRAIRIRLPPRLDAVKVGFDHDLTRSYRPEGTVETTKVVQIPFIDFMDYTQIDGWSSEDTLLQAGCGPTIVNLIRVVGDPIPEIVSFYAKPDVVTVGQKVTLRWVTRNAGRVTADIRPEVGVVQANGRMSVAPKQNTIFTLRLDAPGRRPVTQSVKVLVRPPAHVVRRFKLVRDSRIVYRSHSYFDCVKRWRSGDIICHE